MPIKVYCIEQEYWYIRRQRCTCGGKLETGIQRLLPVGKGGYVDEIDTTCTSCGGIKVFQFELISCGPGYMMDFYEKISRYSKVMSEEEAFQATMPPMAKTLEFIKKLGDEGDTITLSYLEDAIKHTRNRKKDASKNE